MPALAAWSILAGMDAAAHPSCETQPARPRRRMLRYSLRTLLVLVALVAVGLSICVNRAQRQRQPAGDAHHMDCALRLVQEQQRQHRPGCDVDLQGHGDLLLCDRRIAGLRRHD